MIIVMNNYIRSRCFVANGTMGSQKTAHKGIVPSPWCAEV